MWHGLIVLFDLDPFLTRKPLDVYRYLTASTSGPERTILWEATRTTARDAAIGLVAGTVAAVLAAVVFTLRRGVEQTFLPMAWPCGRSRSWP